MPQCQLFLRMAFRPAFLGDQWSLDQQPSLGIKQKVFCIFGASYFLRELGTFLEHFFLFFNRAAWDPQMSNIVKPPNSYDFFLDQDLECFQKGPLENSK